MTKITVNLDDESVVEHLLSDKCEAEQGKPCAFSEHVMLRVVEALKQRRTVTCKHENYDLEPTGTYDSGVLNVPIRCVDCQWTGLVVLGEKVWDGEIYTT